MRSNKESQRCMQCRRHMAGADCWWEEVHAVPDCWGSSLRSMTCKQLAVIACCACWAQLQWHWNGWSAAACTAATSNRSRSLCNAEVTTLSNSHRFAVTHAYQEMQATRHAICGVCVCFEALLCCTAECCNCIVGSEHKQLLCCMQLFEQFDQSRWLLPKSS